MSTGHQPSWKFHNPYIGARVSVYADSKQEAWENLIALVQPTTLRGFVLLRVEVDAEEYPR